LKGVWREVCARWQTPPKTADASDGNGALAPNCCQHIVCCLTLSSTVHTRDHASCQASSDYMGHGIRSCRAYHEPSLLTHLQPFRHRPFRNHLFGGYSTWHDGRCGAAQVEGCRRPQVGFRPPVGDVGRHAGGIGRGHGAPAVPIAGVDWIEICTTEGAG
jgi:hypothetical protein